ncbi:hypothetical protein G6F50_016622 [Rhizopus delemar]|uniref:Uncharacterized protein n=1 Tax=Rhizopus delemar TaxID=936053 RepID=A0A9P7C1H0_9FUNG|nr:hypothetical protein G6F50_016622 [Rhizopus delemar]
MMPMLRSLGSTGVPASASASAGELARASTAAARRRIRQLIMVALDAGPGAAPAWVHLQRRTWHRVDGATGNHLHCRSEDERKIDRVDRSNEYRLSVACLPCGEPAQHISMAANAVSNLCWPASPHQGTVITAPRCCNWCRRSRKACTSRSPHDGPMR